MRMGEKEIKERKKWKTRKGKDKGAKNKERKR